MLKINEGRQFSIFLLALNSVEIPKLCYHFSRVFLITSCANPSSFASIGDRIGEFCAKVVKDLCFLSK